MLGTDIVEETRIVCDDQDSQVGANQLVHTFTNDADGVNIQSGVRLIEIATLGSSIASCRISALFFSPPEKPSLR